MRLGWLVAPGPAGSTTLSLRKRSTTARASSLDQLTLAQLITSGGYDRHIRRCRHNYRRRRDQLTHALRDASPQTHLSGIAAGMHAVLSLPDHLDEAAVTATAARRGLAVEGLRSYRHDVPQQPPALVGGIRDPTGPRLQRRPRPPGCHPPSASLITSTDIAVWN